MTRSMTRWKCSVIVLALLLPSSSGCAQLNRLKVDNAKLETAAAYRDAENQRLAEDLTQERARADTANEQLVIANTDLARVQGEVAAERGRANALEQQLQHVQGLVDRLFAALEKAYARKGRGFIDALVKLKRAGLELKLSVDACNECKDSATGTGGF